MIEELNRANENISKDAGYVKKQFERSLDLLKDYQVSTIARQLTQRTSQKISLVIAPRPTLRS